MMKGNSMARANCCENPFTWSSAGVSFWSLESLLSEGIARQTCERLRIQPSSQGNKHGDAKRNCLRAAHVGRWSVSRLLQPGVDYDAEIVVERRHDIKSGEDREHGMMRFNESQENKILAYETGGGGNAGQRKHEDEKEKRGGRAALIEAVEVIEVVTDETTLAHDDDNREGTYGHEAVGHEGVHDDREP